MLYRQRVLLFANYDQNPKSGDTTDCASGAALLMSLSHYIASHDPGVGVDIVLFDGRYAFNRTNGVNAHLRHCLGSQAWAARHKEETSDYQYGISVSHPATKGTVFAIDVPYCIIIHGSKLRFLVVFNVKNTIHFLIISSI